MCGLLSWWADRAFQYKDAANGLFAGVDNQAVRMAGLPKIRAGRTEERVNRIGGSCVSLGCQTPHLIRLKILPETGKAGFIRTKSGNNLHRRHWPAVFIHHTYLNFA